MKHLHLLILVTVLLCSPPGWCRDATVPSWKTVLIEEVPHVKQRPDFCGEACAEMVLKKLGYSVDQDDVYHVSGVDPVLGRGCRTPELARALERLGFKTGSVWYHVDPARAEDGVQDQWSRLHTDLEQGIPSIICMRTGNTRDATEHFRLVLGYDADKDEVVYHEPAEANGAYRRMKRARFLDLWPLKYKGDRWTLIRLRLQPGQIKAPTRPKGSTDADYAQQIRALRAKVPPKGFTIVLQKPFIVIGDESPAQVRRRSQATVQWATERLKALYFKNDPDNIISIWLFKDKASYRQHTQTIFNDQPTTPFGYYDEAHNALVMNIATGGGTLVHEIVHPFMAANFPSCPAWFNEGLGSLYEQSSSRNGQIIGLTNWRLSGLQEAIRNQRVPDFETLLGTTSHAFYNQDKGTNYAQARYLCFYLQEKNLLKTFYHAFVKDCAKDPTGLQTLRRLLGQKDLGVFKEEWEAFVMDLRFP